LIHKERNSNLIRELIASGDVDSRRDGPTGEGKVGQKGAKSRERWVLGPGDLEKKEKPGDAEGNANWKLY